MFYDFRDYPQLVGLEFRHAQILKEYEAVSHGIKMRTWPEVEKFTGSWQVFGFYHEGRKLKSCCERAPITSSFLEQGAAQLGTRIIMAGFSRMAPGTDILPHVDDVKIDKRIHLGLKIPDGDCGFEVDGAQTKWRAGGAFVFDPRKIHRAWNKTSEERVILLVDFENFS